MIGASTQGRVLTTIGIQQGFLGNHCVCNATDWASQPSQRRNHPNIPCVFFANNSSVTELAGTKPWDRSPGYFFRCLFPYNAVFWVRYTTNSIEPHNNGDSNTSASCRCTLSLSEPHSRVGGNVTLIPSNLSPRRDCGSNVAHVLDKRPRWERVSERTQDVQVTPGAPYISRLKF